MTRTDQGLSESTVRDLEDFVEGWMADEDVPSVSVAVVDPDELLYADGFGARSIDPREPATPDTLGAVASLAKPVVATAVLQLVERDAVALDDDISEYVPIAAEAPGEPMTVVEVLSHSSGMPQDFVAYRETLADREDFHRHVRGAFEHRLTDRDRYIYWNSGYMLLGELIEAVDGRPFERYVEQAVFDPLGMDRSTFVPAGVESDDDRMTAYTDGEDGPTPVEVSDSTYEHAGASGGLLSTARDLSRLVRFAACGGELDGTRVLDASLAAAMLERQSPPSPPALDDWESGYGYGWQVEDHRGDTLVGHIGGIEGAAAYVGLLRERGRGIAVVSNAEGHPVHVLGRGLLAIACGEDPRSVRSVAVREAIDAVTGTYEGYRGHSPVTVSAGPAGTLRLRLDDRGVSVTLSPDSLGEEPTFSMATGAGVRWEAAFRERDDGDGTELVLSMRNWTAVLTER